MIRRVCLSLFMVALVSGSAAPHVASLGGKRPGPTPGVASVTLDQASPHYADIVTFTSVYSPMKWVARIVVACRQDGITVYQSQEAAASTFTLSGGWWFDGAADCTAKLFYFTYKGQTETSVVYLAETSFGVAA